MKRITYFKETNINIKKEISTIRMRFPDNDLVQKYSPERAVSHHRKSSIFALYFVELNFAVSRGRVCEALSKLWCRQQRHFHFRTVPGKSLIDGARSLIWEWATLLLTPASFFFVFVIVLLLLMFLFLFPSAIRYSEGRNSYYIALSRSIYKVSNLERHKEISYFLVTRNSWFLFICAHQRNLAICLLFIF